MVFYGVPTPNFITKPKSLTHEKQVSIIGKVVVMRSNAREEISTQEIEGHWVTCYQGDEPFSLALPPYTWASPAATAPMH